MKKALVIGASGTIGSAIKQELLGRDYDVVTLSQAVTNYSEESLKSHFDILNDQVRESGISFSLIICCIGTLHNDVVLPEKRLAQLNNEALLEYFRINTVIPALCLRFFHPLLDKHTASSFIFLSPMVGSIGDNQLGGWYGYRSSKAALNMMVKTASIEVNRSNKKACLAVVHPGTTQGALSKPFSGGVAKDKYYTPEQSARRIILLSERLTSKQTGQFFNWDGSTLPW